MDTSDRTVKDFQEIMVFLPLFSDDNFEPIIEWKGGEKTEGNVDFYGLVDLCAHS